MKRIYYLLIINIVLMSYAFCGCSADNSDSKIENMSTYHVENEETFVKNSSDEKLKSIRNKYKINIYGIGTINKNYKLDYDENLSLCDSVPYFNVIDKLYIDYNKCIKKTDNSDLFDIVDEYEKTLRKAPDSPDFYITDYKNGVCINRYNGKDRNIVLPETLDGKKVIKIGADVSVDESDVLYNLPFADREIKSITIPSTVKYIVLDALDCYNKSGEDYLESIYVDGDNPYYSSVDGILYNKDKTCLLQIPRNYRNKTVTIPEGTEAVYCINASTTDKVVIPSSVVSFGENYDSDLPFITSDNSSQSVPSAWIYSGSVKSFKVSHNNKYYSSKNSILYDKNKSILLMYPTSNKNSSFTLPDSVSAVGSAVDFGRTNLTSVTIGKNVKNINANYDDINGKKLVVNGYKNTAAEDWAKENNLKFAALD